MSKALCCYAFETLLNKLDFESTKVPLKSYFKALSEDSSKLPQSAPLFVTWNKNSQLRGCIGTFQSLPVESGVAKFTISSAFQDPRFPPISTKEVASLEVDVTLLDNFQPIYDYNDWTVGVHGLKISFEVDNEHYSGTFLPSVAEEQEWDKFTTLYYLLKKADYPVRKSSTEQFYSTGLKEGWLKLTRYEGLKAHLTYDRFIDIRKEILE
ncbi:AMMECR1 family protein [Candida parapsilosis]|uniref:AMMECR1 domain-containing protein n=2 Tax=Candida parapsilosis TaxID=5480 RepID=G8BEF6_CANPC|nr:uncharacterized protein CPAR2_212960 [Candida parapsilosis]KAF6054197.1 AMMECR1 family protein [Candida parapsilosis]KAF6056779.1 AMMECR1 family protein [Candida parapsilosis]KAF6059714.1 AMMECR1 family protein [Candida parapsilosis]KAF6068467.1 AMMECR1 family protein [Candida parapsilosis]KAI5902004.1 Recombinant Thermofilum pendens Protein [Candida parapsilosis]